MLGSAELQRYIPKNRIRFVTATALFDGHDASINIMRRLLQGRGAEVIHLGHNRSAKEIVKAAIEEDVHAVALSSYQGGHVEFFKYIRTLLNEQGGHEIRVFGGGGGVITPKEIDDLESFGISKIYSPEDGQALGLEGIIGHMLYSSDYEITAWSEDKKLTLPRAFTLLDTEEELTTIFEAVGSKPLVKTPVLGITGTGGAGKSSLTDEIIARFLFDSADLRLGLICVDPSKKKTGGALLGDRIRINSQINDRVFIRSCATRGSGKELAGICRNALELYQRSNFDLIIVETSGIGQGDTGILDICDISLYVMTAEFGAQTQLEKIDMLDFADFIAVNKYERSRAPDALRDVRTQLRRSRFKGERVDLSEFPVFGTIASRFEDDGVNGLYRAMCAKLNEFIGNEKFVPSPNRKFSFESSNRSALIPPERVNYLSDISKTIRDYHAFSSEQVEIQKNLEALETTKNLMGAEAPIQIDSLLQQLSEKVEPDVFEILEKWKSDFPRYKSDSFEYTIRGKTLAIESRFESLSHLSLPKVAAPSFESRADLLKFLLKENVPGQFPYTGGLFPFRRTGEDPKRQFAGEGGPKRTNTRFHYLSKNDDAKRLSTAFDSVTLYGADPHSRPDIFGKVGESGVSIASLQDMHDLYSGFDLCGAKTSVSMTINGPAPIILAMFLNCAIDQQIELFRNENGRDPTADEYQNIRGRTLQIVRGTVQADILKEDQAQNTCIFSTEFALKLMGDIQSYFIKNNVRNYYSVSISGYHIAEAGANPITQLALTLSNGFTYVEYYLARGMDIDDFAPNLSFFFSNGLDVEYSVIGRVARRIWAIAMKHRYGASERSMKLKYHIQTSGRSLHAQEIDFNDIRTTLQALMALYDNCNSLHTNAYDEAITTPTEESVRRAMAIQLIINRELGTNRCENINQGSYFLTELTDLVEEAVLSEFDRISSRGGVLGAMETQYQRSKIQEESLYYETLKDSGDLPIIGVNTYINPATLSEDYEREEIELIRASYDEKNDQISRLEEFKSTRSSSSDDSLRKLANTVIEGGNVFEELMNTVRFATLGQITEVLFGVGGKYRRSM